MDYYDLIIVGAGPAGSTLASALENSGKKVLIIDKQNFPRDKTCAGWVTPAVMETLSIDPEEYSRGRTLQPIRRFRIGMMGQPAVENDHGDVVSYGIRRCEFDDYLLSRVNAPKQLATPVKSIVRKDGNWVVNDTWEAPLIVGAGGHFCPVARLLGDGPGGHETVVAAKEVEFEMTPDQASACLARGDTPELWFCRDLKGYAWVFRKGNFLNIGLGREDNHKLTGHLEAFVEEMKSTGPARTLQGPRLSALRPCRQTPGGRRCDADWRRRWPCLHPEWRGYTAGDRIRPSGSRCDWRGHRLLSLLPADLR